MMKRIVFSLLAVLCVGLGTRLSSHESRDDRDDDTHSKKGFTFALIGDMPYGAEGGAKFPNVIADINGDRHLAFVVHDGDFRTFAGLQGRCGNGQISCGEAAWRTSLRLLFK